MHLVCRTWYIKPWNHNNNYFRRIISNHCDYLQRCCQDGNKVCLVVKFESIRRNSPVHNEPEENDKPKIMIKKANRQCISKTVTEPIQVNCQSWDPHYRFLNSNKMMWVRNRTRILFSNNDPPRHSQVSVKPRVPQTTSIDLNTYLQNSSLNHLHNTSH